LDLLAHDPARPFGSEPARTGITVGLREHGRLMGVAAAPVLSKEFRTALLTRVVVSPEARRKGMAAALHYALARRLAAEGIEMLTMSVGDENEAGQALLASLGYVRHEHVLVGAGSLRGAASPGGRSSALEATGKLR
jgi:ribosomal protein S18 acetylase RimI-like enzyme